MVLGKILIVLNAISDLAQALLRGMGAGPRNQLLPAPLYSMIYLRISRTEVALRKLAERFARLGCVPVPRVVAQKPVARAAPVAPVAREVVAAEHPWTIPRRRGWLLWLVPMYAGTAASQLRGLLDEPGMAELLAQSAQARRLVGSLRFALGIRESEIGRDRRAREMRGELAWREVVPSCLDAGWIADAWALIWARPGDVCGGSEAGFVSTG